MDPNRVRFSQRSISFRFKDGRTIAELTAALKSGEVRPEEVPPLRLFEKDGEYFTLDNRRLEAFRRAGMEMPWRLATAEEITGSLQIYHDQRGRVRQGARRNPMIPIAKTERPIDLTEMVEQIQSQPDFVAFSQALLKDLKEKPDGWENRDLPSFLEAMGAWVDDMNGYYQANGGAIPLQPSWKMLGEVLLAAKVYE